MLRKWWRAYRAKDDVDYSWRKLNYVIDNAEAFELSEATLVYLRFVHAMRIHQVYLDLILAGIALQLIGMFAPDPLGDGVHALGLVVTIIGFALIRGAKKEYRKHHARLWAIHEEEERQQ